jgi:tRNA acetyltransferase TAN1
MLRDFNLLATTYRRNERNACSELRYLLEKIGDSAPHIDKSSAAGLIAAKSDLNPFDAVEKLREILITRPYEFRYIFRIIPIERIVHTDLDEIAKIALEFSSRIADDETFRITIEKRFSTISTHDIIEAVAPNIKKKVNLSSPAKILLIEIIGGFTGVSIIRPSDILAVVKEKML